MSLSAVTARRCAALVIAPTAVAYGLIAVGVAGRHGELTTYAGRSPGAALAELAAGWTLIAAGLREWIRPRSRPAGALAIVAGFAWFTVDWIGWQTGPDTVRALGFAAQGLIAAALTQLALGAPAGSPPSAATRLVVAAAWAGTAVVGDGRALVYDPLADPDCVTWCTTNPLLAHGDLSLAHALDAVELALAVLVAVVAAAHVVRRLAGATPVARRTLWPVALPAAMFLWAWAARVVAVHAAGGEDPAGTVLTIAFAIRASALIALGGGLAWTLGRAARGALAVRRLAGRSGSGAGDASLELTLARATGDPTLRVAFWLREGERWIDTQGVDADPPQRRPDRAVTTIQRAGLPVAAVLHHPAVLDGAVLRREIGAAAKIAIDNERLRAQSRAQLRELNASRARIVETADAERRALERDLHDGAQQRLVGLSIAVRMARSAFEDARDERAGAALDDADAGLHQAIAELRELAHGIHPVELTEEGLAAALETLADRAPLPIRIGDLPADRLPAPVETAAYVFADEAARRAGARGSRVTIDVAARRTGARLVVEVHDPGEPSPARALDDLVDVADRIGALAGRLEITPASQAGVLMRAEIPCA